MFTESAPEAQGRGFAGAPTGFRRLTPNLLRADRMAEEFKGLPDGVTKPLQLLAAFKAAAPRLGLSSQLVHAVDWLFRFTQVQDWEGGQRPIVWPSASMQQDMLGLSCSQVKAINRALIEAGVITVKDSPNGKRYGARDRAGRIKEAYGFDLSPIAARHAEFVRLAEEAQVQRVELGRLRRRATIARNGVSQILETAAEYGFHDDYWASLARDARNLRAALRRIERPTEEMLLGVESLERRQREARERLEALLSAVATGPTDPVNSDPKRPENRPHQYSYKPSLHRETNTVIATETCMSQVGRAEHRQAAPEKPANQQETKPTKPFLTNETVLRLTPDDLIELAPRLRAYLATGAPSWPDVVDAADLLRGELGVPKPLWGDACHAMGREEAAIAVAIVSTKPADHFRSCPGGYFHGMVVKAKAGELNLARTIWGLRARDWKTTKDRQQRRIN